jgi:WD40 repeat protein/DNA-binding SARP family transcriptional activator
MASSRLEFQILGPLVVRVDGKAVPAGGPKQRALLALLLLSANRVVSRDRLIGELFPEQSVSSADHALRNHVSRLRKVLIPAVSDEPRLVARSPGYLLRVERGELDLESFELLVAEGQASLAAGDPVAAARSLRAAEALWHGHPLADLEFEPFARIDVERLEELRLAAVEARIEVELALGRQLALVPELEALGAEHPFRERFRAQLMLALYRSGRQAEGLEVYRQTRRLLDDELGLAPGVELQELERAILVQDAALNVSADRRRPPAPGPKRLVCPFKGLAPFEAADAEFFFGRERLIDELGARLSEVPLLAVIGTSGSGKSSLLRAGLLPALETGLLDGSARWRQVLLRPGERPADQLTRALGGELPEVLARVPPGERVIIAVDQFEEVFAAPVGEDERRAFVDALVEAAWDPDGRAAILLALRADFFGRVAPYVELADLVGANHVLLGPMSAGELRRAIEGPAERVGLDLEPELADALVGDVSGEAGGLPLLSTALLDLWLDREGLSLTVAAYERMGGVRGAVGRHAEAAFASLNDESRKVARRVLVRLAAGGDGEALTRRRVTRLELDADNDERIAQVLATLVEKRLLVAHDETIELVHEALLEQWPRLAAWLEEDAQGRRLRHHLSRAAADWEAGGGDPSELYRGARLAAALEWAENADRETGLNRRERAFLEESRLASAREGERQRRANRRLRTALLAVLVVLAVALAAGLLAAEQRSDARDQATAAEAHRLGAQALIDPALDRSLLLAREGVNLDDSLVTRSNLLAALLRSPAAIGVAHQGSDRLLDEVLSPDGRTLAVRGDDGKIVFLDAQTLRRVGKVLPGSDQLGLMGATVGPLHALAYSPDGRTIAIGSTTGRKATLELVDSRTLATRESAIDPYIHTADVAFSPDGRFVATGEPVTGMVSPPDEVIVVRDARTGRTRATSSAIPAGRLAGYTRDGRLLLVGAGNTRSLLLNASTLERAGTLAVGGAAALSPAADQAAFGHGDGSVTLLDLRTERARTLPARAGGNIAVTSFSPDGRTLATGADNGTVTLWDVRSGAVRETFEGHSAAVRAAVFSPDGRTLYTASYDGSVIAWDVSGARRLGQPFRFTPRPGGVATWSDVSPERSLFALSPGPNRITLWRSATQRLLGQLRGPVGDVYGLAFSRDGSLVAAAGSRNAVLWNVWTRSVVSVMSVPHGAAGVAFSPDGRTLAIGRNDGVAALYDLRTGKKTRDLGAAGLPSIPDIDFSPDGKLLASAKLDGTVTVWDIGEQRLAFDLPGAIAAFAVRFSPDGRLVAVGDSSGKVVFWDAAGGKRVADPLAGAGGSVNSIDFDPIGRTLATASQDGWIRLWDVATRKLIGAPLPGSTSGGSVSFFPDGKRLLGVFSSGTGIVWNVDPAAWKTKACTVASRNLSRGEWTQLVGSRSYENVCP